MQFEPLPPVPAVTLARRLRQIPLFRFASVDELFRVSEISQQVRYPAQATVQERGARPEYIQVLVEGAFAVADGDQEPRNLAPPAMLGFQEVLEGTQLQDQAYATSESVALVLPAEEFRMLLSANIELAQGLFRMLFEDAGQGPPSRAHASGAVRSHVASAPLKNVDKVLYLQTIPIFARASAEELYELAALTREVVLPAKASIFNEGEPSAIFLLLAGEMRLESPSGDDRASASAGDCLGTQETLAGIDWPWRAEAVTDVRALQIERDAFIEFLADQMDFLQGIFGTIFYGGSRGLGDH